MRQSKSGQRGLVDALIWSALLVLSVSGAAAFGQEEDVWLMDPDDADIQEEDASDYAWPGGLAAFATRPYEVYHGLGMVGGMDPDGPKVLLDGLEFGFAADAEIRLLVGFGAPTMLQPGMALEYYFAETLDPARAGNIIAAIEVAADQVAE